MLERDELAFGDLDARLALGREAALGASAHVRRTNEAAARALSRILLPLLAFRPRRRRAVVELVTLDVRDEAERAVRIAVVEDEAVGLARRRPNSAATGRR